MIGRKADGTGTPKGVPVFGGREKSAVKSALSWYNKLVTCLEVVTVPKGWYKWVEKAKNHIVF